MHIYLANIMYIFVASLLALTIIFHYFYQLFFGNNKCSGSSKIPPGDLGWPIIGESLEFSSTLQKGFPENFISDRMKKYSPTQVLKTSLLGQKMAVLYGPLGNKLLFANENKLVVTWWPSSIEKVIFSGRPSGQVTNRLRANLQEFLRPDALSRYVPLIQNLVEDHLEKHWIQNKEVIVAPLSKKLIFSIMSRFFIGTEDASEISILSNLFEVVLNGMFSLPIYFPGTTLYRAVKASIQIKKQLILLIKKKRSQLLLSQKNKLEQEPLDLFSKLVLEKDDYENFSSDMDIADMILATIVASYASTSSLMTAVMYYLAGYPSVYARVLEEQTKISHSKAPGDKLTWQDIQQMKYSRNVVNETLRMAGPPGNFKEVVTDFTFGGCIIPKGWKIYLSAHAIHKDKEYFPNPDTFDPTRFEGKGPIPFTFVPFGGGPKMCPGSELARLEALVILHCLVTKFHWEKIYPGEKMIFSTEARPENGLPIRLFSHGI